MFRGHPTFTSNPKKRTSSYAIGWDGICAEKLRLPSKVAGALVARLKVMSDLDIAEKRLPQDGRIIFKKFTRKNIDIDLRVAIGPMNHGEKVVMRILDKTKSALPITALGFSQENLTKYRDCIIQPYGMILHCGPTGSGKSMTLFSALREVASPDVNIQTAEDPIEYTIPGINQMQMHRQIGPHLREGPAMLLADGPGHHPRRGNSRPGDGGNRSGSRAHRSPLAQHPAHQ